MADLTLTGPELAPISGEAPERLIVLLHGLGADGADLLALGEVLSRVFPTAQFVAPDAPYTCDIAPTGKQWFSLQDLSRDQLKIGVSAVSPMLNDYIDAQMKRFDIEASNVAVIGFSQGTMLALHAVLRRPDPVAVVIGFSGMLISPEDLGDIGPAKPPVFLVHGADDPVVPSDMTRLAGEALKLAGFDVEAMIIPDLGHSIDENGLGVSVEILQRAFGDKEIPEN